MSTDVAWSIVRNNSAFLLKKRNCPKPFSTDPLNLTNRYSKRYNGFVNNKAVGIQAAANGQGLTLTLKNARLANRPAKSTNTTALKARGRATLSTVRNVITKTRYRKDLRKAALRRTALILRSQRPLPNRKGANRAAKAATKGKKTE